LILSTDLQIPLQLQSKDAMHTSPACAFHAQSEVAEYKHRLKIKSIMCGMKKEKGRTV
jgi:hypothetical protein